MPERVLELHRKLIGEWIEEVARMQSGNLEVTAIDRGARTVVTGAAIDRLKANISELEAIRETFRHG